MNEITVLDLPLREELVGQQPYGAPQFDVPVRLNTNENPYPPSSKVRAQLSDAVADAIRTIGRYPERDAVELRTALAGYLGFGLTYESIWAANGSNEAMTHVLQAFGGPGRRLLTFTPTYSMYAEYARNTHTEFVTVPRASDFTVDAALAIDAVRRLNPSVVVIANPNNPTGTLIPVAVIDQICAAVDAIVMVDEAYQEFTAYPDDSALALLAKHPRLVVARTMSKAFAFAGGRLGYLAAAPAIVDACRIVRLPYHLSTQTQALAQVALANSDQMLAQVVRLRAAIQSLQSWLRSEGLDVPHSEANFCLFGPFDDRHAVWEGLLEHGVLVREVGPAGYLRVSAGTVAEMSAFRVALLAVLGRGE
ncbi:MAG: histidinol-phosphate transaminase [Propionibacteriaceae bacterium]|jgi:histidinol-phosphate aminotransferase|nr:histidinol-phosphate transaminase [Propionibacteriaceae bacterium]